MTGSAVTASRRVAVAEMEKVAIDIARGDRPSMSLSVQDGRRNVDEAIAALDGMQERARREADERAARERLEAAASASEEKRKAHERSVELADCIKRGGDSAARLPPPTAWGRW